MEELIRFDWAIKYVLRDKANFDILEGFLSALLHYDVQVVELLESESNQEYSTAKFNRVDLVVKTANDEKVLIEVQVESEMDFFQRIAYGGAKLMIEHMEVGQPYRNIAKVIGICIMYFNLGIGNDYVYYGSTSFVGLHQKDELGLTSSQQQVFGVDKVQKLFPEFYIIQVKQFDDTVRQSLDEWIYMLKHSTVKPDFTAKNIQKASEKLRIMNMDQKQRQAYEDYKDDLSYQASMLWSAQFKGFERGLERGLEQGQHAKAVDVVKKSLAQGLALDVIAMISGLDQEEIERIRDEGT